MQDCRIAGRVAEWNPQGKRRGVRPVSTWKDEIRGRMKSRNRKDKECINREVWRGGGECVWIEKNCVFTEEFFNNNNKVN
jgi:hypothetical protein